MGLKRLRTTIKDIANYTGFSVTTISLVLNNKAHKIPKSTKDTILDAAEKLNYHPNQLAVGLVKKRTDTIGLIISDVSNVFFSNLAKGVMIAYMSLSFPDFVERLYTEFAGKCVMSACLLFYLAAFWMGMRIIRIEV